MKKILTTALILGALYGTANATEIKPYVGLDLGYNKMDHKDYSEDWNYNKKTSKKFNYGLNAGAKFELGNNLFAGGELYYRLGKLADLSDSDGDVEDYGYARRTWSYNDKTEIKNTFGAKLYFGYEFNDKLNAFASFGLNRMQYKFESEFRQEVYSYSFNNTQTRHVSHKYTKSKFTPSYGFGINYQVIDNLEARLSYEFLNYKTKVIDEDSYKFNTHSIRLGVNYLF